MNKFHINKHGVPAPCRAKKGNCPLGGDEQHFNTEKEAQDFADKQGEEKHGIIPTLKAEVLSVKDVEELYKSSNPDDRIKAIENGFDMYTILSDPSEDVRMVAAERGLMSDSLMHDDNKEIAEIAKAHYYKTPNGRLDKLHDELVPSLGKAETVAGEIVRAASRLNYRFYNDGDRIAVDYGNETCNSSARYLIEELEKTEAGKDISDELINLWEEPYISDNKYEYKLQSVIADISEYVETNPHLREAINNKDSRDDYSDPSDYDYWDNEDDEEEDEDFY